jgi:uncharacterized protein
MFLAVNDEIIKTFLDRISPVKDDVCPMLQFGSRCRDDFRPDSDYDLLVVLEKKDRRIISQLYEGVMEVLLSTGKLISLKIFTKKEFDRLRSLPTPFMENVLREGIRIG